ncbi:MAG: Lacal_2735 family protein [Bacteroidetes bacterium]|nr:Lacal_2735 family protein [Bacteroidota bacterium]
MFRLFKKTSQVDKLGIKYKKLLEEAFKLSSINRKMSDDKISEANDILNKIEKIKENKHV